MEFSEILQRANHLCLDAQIAFNDGQFGESERKLTELKTFLVDNFDDMTEEPTPEAAADEAATEAETTAKEACQEDTVDLPSES